MNRDENLVDIETDKVVLETPAPESGVLVKIVKGDGGTVTSNEVIAQIDTEAAKAAEAKGAPHLARAPARAGRRPQRRRSASGMPAAQKLAAEKNVDTARDQRHGPRRARDQGRRARRSVQSGGERSPAGPTPATSA